MCPKRKIARAYFKLLSSIDWEDEMMVAGLREGLNKFLSNAYIAELKKSRGKSKYDHGDYYSGEAKKKLKAGDYSGLVYEHMIPKQEYIQRPCEELARRKKLTIKYIEELLLKWWKIAIVTIDQDKQLSRTKMPNNWDGKDIKARFNGIKLEPWDT